MHYMEYTCAYACALISLNVSSTAETDVSSVGNNFTIARQCCGSNPGSHKINTRAVRAVHVIHTHTHTDYCNYPSCACTKG